MPKLGSKYSEGLEGRRYGRWIVLSFSHSRGKIADGLEYCWLCRCDCGNEKIINARMLARGKSRSCGCLKLELNLKMFTKHGQLKGVRYHQRATPSEYSSWIHAFQRTHSQKHNKAWHRYGGRGITVCAGFRDFGNFFRLMGHKPTRTHSVDRINNDGHYSCGKCHQCRENEWPLNTRWATPKEQSANQARRNRSSAQALP